MSRHIKAGARQRFQSACGDAPSDASFGGCNSDLGALRPLQHADLMTQSQVLEFEGSARAKDRTQSGEECRERNEHRRRDYGSSINRARSDASRFSRSTVGELRVEQAGYRGQVGTPKTKGSRRTVPLPEPAIAALRPLQGVPDSLVFQSEDKTPYRDNNPRFRELKPAGVKIGAPWLNWHTLRRTHATLLQAAGGSLKDASAQLGHRRNTPSRCRETKKINGRHEETRTPDLYRVKVAL